MASLDHDLGQIQMVTARNPGHGYDVARFIAKFPHLVRRVVVHSFNPGGAMAMEAVLLEAGVPVRRLPFGPDSIAAALGTDDLGWRRA